MMMLLPEMTSSARVARAFQRLARGAVVGLALGGLAACGGGGSSTPATPQMTITPGGDTLANAVDVTGKETTEGRLDSPDDIQYYQWEAPEDGTFEFTLNADAGLELAILDSGGNVITTAETASPAAIQYTLEKGKELYFRISDAAKKAGPKVFKFVAKNLELVQTVVNFIKGIPRIELAVAGRGVTLDLSEYVSLPDGADTSAVTTTLTTPLGIKLTSRLYHRTTFRLDEPSPSRPDVGVSHLSVCFRNACTDAVVNFLIRQAVTVKPDYWGSRDEAGYATRGVVSVNIEAPGTWSSQPLGEYFNSPDNTQLSFAVAPSQSVVAEIRDSRLVVRAPLPQSQPVDVVVSATGPQNSAALTFRVTIESEEEEEPGNGGGITWACLSSVADGRPTHCTEVNNTPYTTCGAEERVSSCPRTATDATLIYSCQGIPYSNGPNATVGDFRYHYHDLSGDALSQTIAYAREVCISGQRGVFTVHKR